jgi:peptide/nickel transport system permease protein
MTSYIIRRLLIGIVVLFVVSILIFFIMRLLPGDPLWLFIGSNVNVLTQDQIDLVRHQYGLDQPVIVQYFNWLWGVLHGNLGKSVLLQQSVNTMVAQRVPVTFYIGSIAFVLSCFFGILFGVICAVKRGKWQDTLFSIVANLGITLPVFWVGILLIYLLSVQLDILPTYGYISPFEDLGMSLKMLIMPVFCEAVFSMASITRQTRSSMLEISRQDYIRTAWAKGLRERVVVVRHIIKNGLIPVVTAMGMQISVLIGGSVLVETVFSIPGMGRMMRDAVIGRDYQVVQGGALVIAVVIILINILVDIVYGWIDPRIRYS